jgi:hypothetical protein
VVGGAVKVNMGFEIFQRLIILDKLRLIPGVVGYALVDPHLDKVNVQKVFSDDMQKLVAFDQTRRVTVHIINLKI